ncbi:unnamed protein product [Peronospora farinosa]|uniref:Uncharacterized protein n=1 Tax=Peronospora farinosa TaxID=134698 RepID=A0AAV0TFI1_9STRA|nr:unnamed protein product [Peronospora farinosa]CAI5719856.1 unnamed protein product [Peronospora farinosa]
MAVESSVGTTEAFRMMWRSIWDRELTYMTQVNHVTLADAIRHCSTVDAFASMVLLPKAKEHEHHLPGFYAVMKVIHSLFADVSDIILAFAHVRGRAGSGALSHVIVPTRMGISSTKRILQSYLSDMIMKSLGARHVMASPSVDKAPALRRVSPLKLLFYLYIFFSPVTDQQQDDSCFRYWDALMTQINNDYLAEESAQNGIAWCRFLEKCVIGVDTETLMTMRYDDNFLRAFQRYCHAIMYGIVVTGGEVISSGGKIRRLIRKESDRLTVRQVLVQMMTTFGEDWITGFIAQLLRGNASLHSTREFNPRGVKTLFFPALVLCMKSRNRANLTKRKTVQQQFTAIVHSVNAILNESNPTPLYLVSLIRFCEAWDTYQSSHTKEAPTISNRWGLCAMTELDVLPELLECYSMDEVIQQETSEALMFVAEVLQNTPSCPKTLETSLFKVLSAVKASAEQGKSMTSSVPVVIDQALVSHSSDVLKRLLRAVRSAGVTQTRQLMSQIKDSVGMRGELRQQLEQWFSFVEMNGTAFAGKESRLELSLLCTRLIRWFPNEFENMQFLLMTPLDSHLVFALEAFVKEAGRPNNMARQSVLNSTRRSALQSAVRVEMALHSYFSAAAFPDLETLTVLLAKAIVKCRLSDAFDHLTKVATKNGRVLLPETAVTTLSSPLRGLEFSCSALSQQDEDGDDDGQFKSHARHAKSIIYQENTLKLLAVSPSIFAGGLSWSTILFGERSAVVWLPHLFEYVLKTDFCEGILRADMLFRCLDALIRKAEFGKEALREAYWLAALLNTSLIACTSRSAGACAVSEEGIPNRLRQMVENVLQLLSFPSDTTTTQVTYNKDNAPDQLVGILSLRNSSRFAKLVIKEDSASWSGERFVGEKAGSALQMIVSATWNAGTKTSQATVMQPSMQLFMPFSHWLSGALVYSQSFLEELSASMRRWERTFTCYVTDLYLHLEFEDVTYDLLRAWLTTWITSNIARGQEEIQLLALLPSQVALFRRLSLTPYRGSSCGQIRVSTSVWQLVFAAVLLAVDIPGNSVAIEQAIELVVSTMTTLELVELSSSSDFVPFNHVQDIEPFFLELETFLSRPQLRFCSVAQVCSLLQFPLELLVCCYACKIPVDLIEESQLFLQRVECVLRANFSVSNVDEVRDDTKESTLQEPSRATNQSSIENTSCHPLLAVDSMEIEAFFQYWKDEMFLKYDYMDRERCAAILKVIQAAMVHRIPSST